MIETLQTLCKVRLAAEREAERLLARAAALYERERQREAGLSAELDAARSRRDQARRDNAPVPARAAAIQTVQRYAARLDAELRAIGSALEVLARGPLAQAATALDRARADHVRARQRREAVERAIARREAAGRRDQARRAEMAADDLAQRRR